MIFGKGLDFSSIVSMFHPVSVQGIELSNLLNSLYLAVIPMGFSIAYLAIPS